MNLGLQSLHLSTIASHWRGDCGIDVRDVPFQPSRLGSWWKLLVQRSASKEEVRAGLSPQAARPCRPTWSGQLSLPGLGLGWLCSTEAHKPESLSGFTKVHPSSLAKAVTWDCVLRDGAGRQETQDPFSWPEAELRGLLSSGRVGSGQKVCLMIKPGGEERKKIRC